MLPVIGEVVKGKHTAVAYLDQARSGLDDDRTVTCLAVHPRDRKLSRDLEGIAR